MNNPIYEFAGLEIETPLVNAAGSINGINPDHILDRVETLAKTSIGAITVGSLTVPRQEGNIAKFGEPVYYHNQATGATYNSLGLPNIGLIAARQLMPEIVRRAHEKGKPVIVSVSGTLPTPEINDTYTQLKALVHEMLLTDADLVEVNVSCPNVVTEGGGRKPMLGYDLEGMQELVEELLPITGTGDTKVGVKLPPYSRREDKQMVPELAKLFRDSRVFEFLVTSNTIPNQIPRNKKGRPILSVTDGKGGMSGSPTKNTGREQLKIWSELVGDELEIISTLGVDSGSEVAARLNGGADMAGGVTFLLESEDWGTAVTKMVSDWAESA